MTLMKISMHWHHLFPNLCFLYAWRTARRAGHTALRHLRCSELPPTPAPSTSMASEASQVDLPCKLLREGSGGSWRSHSGFNLRVYRASGLVVSRVAQSAGRPVQGNWMDMLSQDVMGTLSQQDSFASPPARQLKVLAFQPGVACRCGSAAAQQQLSVRCIGSRKMQLQHTRVCKSASCSRHVDAVLLSFADAAALQQALKAVAAAAFPVAGGKVHCEVPPQNLQEVGETRSHSHDPAPATSKQAEIGWKLGDELDADTLRRVLSHPAFPGELAGLRCLPPSHQQTWHAANITGVLKAVAAATCAELSGIAASASVH